jgi:plastocyanin
MTTMPKRLLLLAAVLGGALIVLPAVAGSETSPTIEAENKTTGSGYYTEEHHTWKPSQVAVAAGGAVTISNPTAVNHGVEWVGGPVKPTCSSGVPVGTSASVSGRAWNGTCTFTQPGTYTFYCTVHHAEMTGTITVTTAETPTPGPTPTPTPTPVPHPGEPGPEGSPGSPLTGGSKALKLSSGQRGSAVRGSIDVSQAGAGGRLEVGLFATSASLAKAHRSAKVRVGRFSRSSLKAGVVSFAVPLTARGRSALRRHKRLALTVRIALTPVSGAAASMTRSVVLHA